MAMLTFQVHRSAGGKADMKDFLLYTPKDGYTGTDDVDSVVAAFKAVPSTRKFKRS